MSETITERRQDQQFVDLIASCRVLEEQAKETLGTRFETTTDTSPSRNGFSATIREKQPLWKRLNPFSWKQPLVTIVVWRRVNSFPEVHCVFYTKEDAALDVGLTKYIIETAEAYSKHIGSSNFRVTAKSCPE